MNPSQRLKNPAFLFFLGVVVVLIACAIFLPRKKVSAEKMASKSSPRTSSLEGRSEESPSLEEKEPLQVSSLSDEHLLALSRSQAFEPLTPQEQVVRARCNFQDPAAIDRPSSTIIAEVSAGKLSPREFEAILRAKLFTQLQSSDIEDIFQLLEACPSTLDSSLYHALANDAMRVLVQNGGLESDEHWFRYRALIFGPSMDPVVADYMVQHLDFRHQDARHRNEVESLLFEALLTNHGTIDGAALLVLGSLYDGQRLQSSLPEFKRHILTVLSAKGRNPVSRIAALGLAKKFQLSAAVEPSLALLQRSSLNYPGHRLAASLVREFGSDAHLEQLLRIEDRSFNPLLVRAIRESTTL